MAREALSFSDVDAYYGDSHILHGVALQLEEGRLLGLLGRNGAGKTTCMNVVVGVVAPRRGNVRVFGEDMTGAASERVAARGIALVPQGRRVFKSLSVRENLAVAARRPFDDAAAANGAGWSIEAIFAMFPRLRERSRQAAGLLSGGEQQMLAIGRALMSNPRILLMDEPSEGLAPQIVAEVMSTIRRLKSDGLSILLVEQNPKLVFGLADDIVILNSGRVAAAGPAEVLARQRGALEQHLGIV